MRFLHAIRCCAQAFTPYRQGKWLADLFMLARQRLARCGVGRYLRRWFVHLSDPQRFYSYRRDKTTGRMAALIWRENPD